jgi:hypothetical protein
MDGNAVETVGLAREPTMACHQTQDRARCGLIPAQAAIGEILGPVAHL